MEILLNGVRNTHYICTFQMQNWNTFVEKHRFSKWLTLLWCVFYLRQHSVKIEHTWSWKINPTSNIQRNFYWEQCSTEGRKWNFFWSTKSWVWNRIWRIFWWHLPHNFPWKNPFTLLKASVWSQSIFVYLTQVRPVAPNWLGLSQNIHELQIAISLAMEA